MRCSRRSEGTAGARAWVRRVARHVDVGDDDAGRGPGVVGRRELPDGLRGEVERRLGLDARDVERDRGVAPGLVFHRGVEPNEESATDATSGRVKPFGQPRADVCRAHPALAGVGVVDGDDGHTRSFALPDKPVSGCRRSHR